MTTLAQFHAQRCRAIRDVGPYRQPPHEFLQQLPTVEVHTQHVLPGAKRAITHVQLEAWQAEGLDELAMVERVNTEWAKANAHRVEAFEAWRTGPLAEAVERAKEKEMLRAIANAENEARIESQLKARDAERSA